MALTGKKEQLNEVLNQMPSTPLPNKVFRNLGNLRFADAGADWGFDTPSFSNGAAYADLDNDGDLDLVVNNVNQEAFLYRNRSNEKTAHHHLRLQLRGKGQNTFAIGATATVYQNGQQLNFQLYPTRGFQSSVDYQMVFGLGEKPAPDSLVIVWPDKRKTVQIRPPVDTLLRFSWEQANAPDLAINPYDLPRPGQPFFQEMSSSFSPHRENDFIDFYQEPLSFRMLSREGPKAAVADVNGDGLDDVFIGGGTGQAGQLYLQTTAGTFRLHSQASFAPDAQFEDTAAAFFDADGDGDPDLFVGSGGNEQPVNSRFLEPRLYRNDGRGNFTKNERALPPAGLNTAFGLPLDFDQDGDLDLLIGSRSVPALYGPPPRHFLCENDGKGTFRDVTRSAGASLRGLGMLTDARLVDLLGDARPELVLTGEWLAPKVFELKNGRLEPVKTQLDQYSGWWSAVQAADLDGDGDQDLVLGNRGENFYFQASAEAPAKIWVGDFDQNGSIDKIVTRQVGGRDMPLALKKELTSQLPFLKKSSLKHAEYAKKAIQDLFAPEVLKNAVVSEANYFQSAVALNAGNGNFTLVPLPAAAQFSSICAIWAGPLDSDPLPDLVAAGNHSGFTPQFPKLDASFGQVLLNRGKGQFERVENRAAGFSVRGEVKTLAPLRIRGKIYLLATVNGQAPRLFLVKNPTNVQ
ncbi:MAG: VCBS repeat-containing protein [Saprospiraceae bacterium]|nr:VCBS repeat-containing protein [Saprospiraceae bacterium]